MPVGGLLIAVFIGWKVKRKYIAYQMTNRGTVRCRFLQVIIFCLRYVAPAGIILIFLNAIGLI